MRSAVFFILCAYLNLGLAGCAGTPAGIAMMSEEGLRVQDTLSLCNAYGRNKSDKVRRELEARGAVEPWEWDLIEQKSIEKGMSVCGLLCSWGEPGRHGSVKRSASSPEGHVQWVYRSCPGCRAAHVTTENGKVTGWQH